MSKVGVLRKQEAGLVGDFSAQTPQLFAGGGGAMQAVFDPTRPDVGELQPNTLGTHDSHFKHPTLGVIPHPLAGQKIINPEGGKAKYPGWQRNAMRLTQAAGMGLGAYTALTSFADESDQDPLSAGLNALGSGYTTYAMSAAPAAMAARAADRRLRRQGAGISQERGESLVNRGVGQLSPRAMKNIGVAPPNPMHNVGLGPLAPGASPFVPSPSPLPPTVPSSDPPTLGGGRGTTMRNPVSAPTLAPYGLLPENAGPSTGNVGVKEEANKDIQDAYNAQLEEERKRDFSPTDIGRGLGGG